MSFRREKIQYKSRDQLVLMRAAGLVVCDALDAVAAAIRPGLTTADLDAIAHGVIVAAGARPNFLGYHGYPASICASVNDVVVHGIPSGERVLAPGDVVSIDCGAELDGWHGDSARTFVLAGGDDADVELSAVCETSLWSGIAAMAGARRVGEIGVAVEAAVRERGNYGILEDYTGHGIGTAMHMPPDVLNYAARDLGPELRAGMALAIEPMITRGGIDTTTLRDDWTVVTDDHTNAAHWEHSVALLPEGICVLTARDAGAAGLAPFGIVPVQL